MIDFKTGDIFVAGLHPPIGRGLSRTVFVKSALGTSAELMIRNGNYEAYRVFTSEFGVFGAPCAFLLHFTQGVLTRVTIGVMYRDLPGDFGGWSRSDEAVRKRRVEERVSEISPTPGRTSSGSTVWEYTWGSVRSEFDAKTGDSTLVVTYMPT